MHNPQVSALDAYFQRSLIIADVLPVIVGLAVGTMFVAMFSMYAISMPPKAEESPDINDHMVMKISNVRDVYRTNEPISFAVGAKGVSDNLCNRPEPSVSIFHTDGGKAIWNTPPTFQTAMKCLNVQGIDREWRFGYDDEELPFQSSVTFDEKYNNDITISEPGSYRIIASFEDNVIEKEFSVYSADSGVQVTPEQVPDWRKIEVVIVDSDD